MERLLVTLNVSDNRIQESWHGFFVDRRVHATLDELFSAGESARDLVALVAKRVPELPKADIRASLARARASFDFPPASIPATPRPATATPTPDSLVTSPELAGTGQRPRRYGTLVSGAERRLTLRDVIDSGRLQAGCRIEADYMGEHHTAEILAAGQVRYGGETYGSLSRAGAAVKQAVRGADIPESVRATDGWAFWRAIDARAGDAVTLKVIRQRVADGRTTVQPQ